MCVCVCVCRRPTATLAHLARLQHEVGAERELRITVLRHAVLEVHAVAVRVQLASQYWAHMVGVAGAATELSPERWRARRVWEALSGALPRRHHAQLPIFR